MDDTLPTQCWVNLYRELGLCPLPSCGHKKAPQLSTYRGAYELKKIPEWVYSTWTAPNIQLITGCQSPTPTKILVVDCDGEKAIATWQQMCAFHQWFPSPSWTVRTGGGGLHFYFQIPSSTNLVKTGLIWGLWDSWGKAGRGGWVNHEEIKILGDRSLVIAPPSIHPGTFHDYDFVGPDRPESVELPEEAPSWLLKLTRLSSPVLAANPVRTQMHRYSKPLSTLSERYDRNSILKSISDKVRLVRTWGLDFVTLKTSTGWLPCFVPVQESRNRSKTPSGSFHVETGVLKNHTDGTVYSLFDLGVKLGVFDTWIDALHWCAKQFGGQKR